MMPLENSVGDWGGILPVLLCKLNGVIINVNDFILANNYIQYLSYMYYFNRNTMQLVQNCGQDAAFLTQATQSHRTRHCNNGKHTRR